MVTGQSSECRCLAFECMYLQLTPFDRKGVKNQEADDQIKADL